MIVAVSISPAGTPQQTDASTGPVHADPGGGVSAAVASAVAAIRASGLPCETNAMFTNIEGEWDEVMAAVKAAVDAVAPYGSRVSLVLKADIRPGYDGQLSAKVERVEQHLAAGEGQS